MNASLYKKLAYDPVRDFVPISKVVDVPFLLVTAPSTGISSVTDLIARGKKDPNALTYASVGQGSASHVTAELFRRQAGIEMQHVPYRGGAPATNDTLAGQVSVYFITPLEGMGQVQAGMLKSLGISTAERSPLFPDTPTINEALPGFQVVVWFGILAPAGTRQRSWPGSTTQSRARSRRRPCKRPSRSWASNRRAQRRMLLRPPSAAMSTNGRRW